MVRRFIIFIFFVSLISSVFAGLAGADSGDKPVVVATTCLIGSIVGQIAAEEVELITIIPAGVCPGHFDLKPSDAKGIEDAGLILMHGFEGERLIDSIVQAVNSKDLQKRVVDVEGNWMVPDNYIKAIDAISLILSGYIQDREKVILERAGAYTDKVAVFKGEILARLSAFNPSRINVVCSDMQRPFVEWAGFNIISTYPRAEDTTIRELEGIIDKAVRYNVSLVIDNLQSGQDTGVMIARQIGAEYVVLTNFPQEFDGRLSYIKSLTQNLDRLVGAAKNLGIHE